MTPSDASEKRTPGGPESAVEKTAFDWPRDAGMTERVMGEMQREVARRRRHRRQLLAATASLVLLVALFWPRRVTPGTTHAGTVAAVARAAAPARQTLPDGSVVVLREQAEVAVEYTPAVRRVILRRGEASFTVAKNAARPFVVEAGAISVRAVGTEFFVTRGEANVDVLVTEGCVAVAPGLSDAAPAPSGAPWAAAPTLVNAGRSVSVDIATGVASAVVTVPAAELDRRSAWRAPTLTFARTPLHEVVETMNRYGAIRLALEDASVADVKLSGAIRADNVDALLELLAADYGIQAQRRGEFQIALGVGPETPRAATGSAAR